MKKAFCMMLALAMLAAAGSAAADQAVRLPESRYTLILPDSMEYDGPTPDSDEAFAYVSGELGLEISFFRYDARGANLADLRPKILEKGADDVQITAINGVEMLVYRIAPYDASGMKCIGYILVEGNTVQEIVFWYATDAAAKATKSIMESIY